jgi:hypothetical protein
MEMTWLVSVRRPVIMVKSSLALLQVKSPHRWRTNAASASAILDLKSFVEGIKVLIDICIN